MRTAACPLAAVLLLLPACAAPDEGPKPTVAEQIETERETNLLIVRRYRSEQVAEGIIRSRSIHAASFVVGSDRLNAIGRNTVETLANHYRGQPLEVFVERGDADDDLYERRRASVLASLVLNGLESERVVIGDGLSGGDGVSSQRMRDALQREKESSAKSGAGQGSGDSEASGATIG